MKLQNNDIITLLKILYGTSFEIFIYKNNKQNIYIYYVFSSFNRFFFSELTASIMYKRDWWTQVVPQKLKSVSEYTRLR